MLNTVDIDCCSCCLVVDWIGVCLRPIISQRLEMSNWVVQFSGRGHFCGFDSCAMIWVHNRSGGGVIMLFRGVKEGPVCRMRRPFFAFYQVAFRPLTMTAGAGPSAYIDNVIAAFPTSLASAQSRASWSESRRVVGASSWPSGSHVIKSWISS